MGFRAEIGSHKEKDLGLEVEKQKGHFWAEGPWIHMEEWSVLEDERLGMPKSALLGSPVISLKASTPEKAFI